MTRIQKGLGGLIWVFFAFEAIRLGMSVPTVDGSFHPKEEVPVLVFAFIFAAVFAGFFELGLWRTPKSSSYRRFVQEFKFKWLAVMFFAGSGGLATFNWLRLEAPKGSLFFPLLMLSAGLGILLGNAISAYRNRRDSHSS
jgi:hypothetical protein